MSAFIVPHSHITLLAVFIKLRGLRPNLSLQQIGEKLYRENVKSYCDRYPDEVDDFGRFEIDERAVFIRPPLMQIIKAAHCLEYQSCEHASYMRSDAYRMVHEADRRATQELERITGKPLDSTRIYDHPDYNDAAWVFYISTDVPDAA